MNYSHLALPLGTSSHWYLRDQLCTASLGLSIVSCVSRQHNITMWRGPHSPAHTFNVLTSHNVKTVSRERLSYTTTRYNVLTCKSILYPRREERSKLCTSYLTINSTHLPQQKSVWSTSVQTITSLSFQKLSERQTTCGTECITAPTSSIYSSLFLTSATIWKTSLCSLLIGTLTFM